ncbi:MAG: hypothetical protein J6C87_04110 [Bacteroides sp.]|nr:hypothetical protein [Bacteroides sp.]
MKKLSLVFALLLMCMCATAQITWNVKAGVGIATLSGLNDEGSKKMKFGWKVGVGIEKPLAANWLIMPSLELSRKAVVGSLNIVNTVMKITSLLITCNYPSWVLIAQD